MFKNNKKFIIMFIIINILLIINNIFVFADDEDEEILNNAEIDEVLIEASNVATDEPIINARAAVIFDRQTGKIIWGKNENKKRAIASTTKIMTAIVVLENSNLDDIVIVSRKAAGIGGSRLKIKEGDKISVKDLLYGLMLRSRK